MSVDAIQKIIEAEVEAEEIIQETAALIQEKNKRVKKRLMPFVKSYVNKRKLNNSDCLNNRNQSLHN
ncbi:hypothetical protein ACFQOY_09360 [Enterococcus alcedinis]|uniref:hypothetical protein n=1 Tax=Enterococcus alcedinis TaxID=1274384 RepID=UPI00360E81ED